MTSARPYRRAMLAEDALSELASGAGTQFDAKLTAAFVEHMRGLLAEQQDVVGPGTTRDNMARA